MNYDGAAKIMMISNNSGQDPRIAAIESAKTYAEYEFSNGWVVKIKFSDELCGRHIRHYPNDNYGRVYSYYKEIVLWSCYYKNDEFMFANFSSSNYTDIPGDYYKTDEGVIYKSVDRITEFSEVINFEVLQSYPDNPYPFGVFFRVTLKGNETYTYYKPDGSISSQNKSEFNFDWITLPLKETYSQLWSNEAIYRKDNETYINDVLDFSYS